MYNGGIKINGHQFWRERGIVSGTIVEESIDRMADGSMTVQYAYTKKIITGGFDYLKQEDLDFLLNAKENIMTIEYYEEGGTEQKEGKFYCTEWGQMEIRDWDLSQNPPAPYWTIISFTFEEI